VPAPNSPRTEVADAGVAGTGVTTIGVAIDIPKPWGPLLTRRRAAAGDPAAAHVPAHLTLLGPTVIALSDLPAVESYLAEVAAEYSPFTLHLRGTGTFRPLTEVVFVAVAAGISECEQLHEALLAAPQLSRTERFPYHPHVTVAHNVPPEQLDAAFADLAGFEASFQVNRFTLFEHTASGRWRAHREYPLHGGVDARSAVHRRR
jgi:2'-5' RNA ligase